MIHTRIPTSIKPPIWFSEPVPPIPTRKNTAVDLEDQRSYFIPNLHGGYICSECGCGFRAKERIYIYDERKVFHEDCIDSEFFEILDPDRLVILYYRSKSK